MCISEGKRGGSGVWSTHFTQDQTTKARVVLTYWDLSLFPRADYFSLCIVRAKIVSYCLSLSLIVWHSCFIIPQLLLYAFPLLKGIEGQIQAPWSIVPWPHVTRKATDYLSRRQPEAVFLGITLTNGISLCCRLVCWNNHCIIKPTAGFKVTEGCRLVLRQYCPSFFWCTRWK